MKRILSFSLFIVIANGVDVSELRRSGLPRIVGGEFIEITDTPYLAQVLRDGEMQCGGSILSNYWIVTAAHCIEGPVNITIITGSSWQGTDGVLHTVEKYILHENYDDPDLMNNDIALIKVVEPIKFNLKQQPIEISTRTPQIGDDVIVSGFGLEGEDLPDSKLLKSTVVQVVNHEECQKLYKKIYVEVTKNMFCAHHKGTDSCHRDSGGPAVTNGKLVGIVSFGVGCAGKYPGVYTRIYNHRKWITKHTGLNV